MSKFKFHIFAIDLENGHQHFTEMWRAQTRNVMKACDNNMAKLMTFLEFKYGKLMIKDFELLLQYQLF